MDEFKLYASQFYEKLAQIYPDAKIIGITPTWTSYTSDVTPVGGFYELSDELSKIIESVSGYVVNGVDLIPHGSKYYGDGICLHPNDAGFEFYAKNLYEAVKDIIK
jgi:hypothetical protein